MAAQRTAVPRSLSRLAGMRSGARTRGWTGPVTAQRAGRDVWEAADGDGDSDGDSEGDEDTGPWASALSEQPGGLRGARRGAWCCDEATARCLCRRAVEKRGTLQEGRLTVVDALVLLDHGTVQRGGRRRADGVSAMCKGRRKEKDKKKKGTNFLFEAGGGMKG